VKWKKVLYFVAIVITLLVATIGYTFYADVTAIERMKFNVDYVSIPEIGFTYFKLNFVLNISNPSNNKISSLSVKSNIYITNISVGNGSISDISLHAHSSVKRNMELTISYAGVMEGVVDAIKKGRFILTVKGKGMAEVMWGLTKASRTFEIAYMYPPQ
jgi:LEA14-like dessication related protein